jgi:bifunctional DNA-binding transcriptional regulator/antitoxin component of YhaV-PrlF toxin-antitoxin module
MKVLFETKKLQKTGRVALSEQLLRNAGLQEGDPVDIYFDAATKNIILQRSAPASSEVAAEGKPTNMAKERK